MAHPRGVAVVVVSMVAVFAPDARAERRAFTNTFEYLTMEKGGVQIDVSTTQAYGTGTSTVRAFQLQLDAVFGITDRWDVAAFQVFDENTDDDPMTADSAFHYTESRFRTRYRFAERGELPVDLLAYLDLKKSFRTDAWGVAPRAVVARDIDRLSVVANLSGELEFGAGTTLFALGWAFGATYEVVPELKLGAEIFGAKQLEGGDTNVAWAGPSISWAPTPKAWIAGCAGFGLTSASIDLRQQVIIGLVL